MNETVMPKVLGRLHKSKDAAATELGNLVAEAEKLHEEALGIASADRALHRAQLSDPTVGFYQAVGHDVGEQRIGDAADAIEAKLTLFWKRVDVFFKTTFDDAHAKELAQSLYLRPDFSSIDLRTQHLLTELEGLSLNLPHYSEVSAPNPSSPLQSVEVVLRIFDQLRAASKPLCERRKGKLPLALDDEYDVQDVLHALLTPWFDDIRPEEWTPSYASSSKRMDFLLKKERIAIETKYVSDSTRAKHISDEIAVDIEHYAHHKDVETLLALIFDPNGAITHRAAIESDISGRRSLSGKQLTVYLRIRPPL